MPCRSSRNCFLGTSGRCWMVLPLYLLGVTHISNTETKWCMIYHVYHVQEYTYIYMYRNTSYEKTWQGPTVRIWIPFLLSRSEVPEISSPPQGLLIAMELAPRPGQLSALHGVSSFKLHHPESYPCICMFVCLYVCMFVCMYVCKYVSM